MAKSKSRANRKEAFWRGMIRRQAGSGMSIRAWCRQQDVSEAAFYWWRRKFQQQGEPEQAAAFVPVHVVAEERQAETGLIEIVLTDGLRVRVAGSVNRQALVDVLAALSYDTESGPGQPRDSDSPAECRPC